MQIYDNETWTVNKIDRSKLKTTEIWTWKKMIKTRWIDEKISEQVLEEIQENR